MCGNGIRCLSCLAYNLGYVRGNGCTVETLSGIKKIEFVFSGKQISAVRVDMGVPVLNGKDIPSVFDGESNKRAFEGRRKRV